MGLFSRFFNKTEEKQIESQRTTASVDTLEWEPIPGFIQADSSEYELVSVIATAIAAGAYPDSQFVVKRILQRNPEALEMSLIAASIAATHATDVQLSVKNIYRKKL